MSSTGLEAFDRTLQETNSWLKSLMSHLRTDNRHLAYFVLKATLHALRDHLGPKDALNFGEQLPMLIRGFYYEGWHGAEALPVADKHEFLERIRAELPANARVAPTRAAHAVFEVMRERIAPQEVARLMKRCPGPLRDLWLPVAAEEQD